VSQTKKTSARRKCLVSQQRATLISGSRLGGTARAGVISGTVGELLRQSQSSQAQTVRWRAARSWPAEEGRESGCEATLSNSPPLHRRVPWALLRVDRRPGRELKWLTSVYRNRCFWQLQRALKTHDLKPRKSHPGLVPKTTGSEPCHGAICWRGAVGVHVVRFRGLGCTLPARVELPCFSGGRLAEDSGNTNTEHGNGCENCCGQRGLHAGLEPGAQPRAGDTKRCLGTGGVFPAEVAAWRRRTAG